MRKLSGSWSVDPDRDMGFRTFVSFDDGGGGLVEYCNGVDDDGDGLVDEGYGPGCADPDLDGDSVANEDDNCRRTVLGGDTVTGAGP